MVGNGTDGPMVRKIYTALLAHGALPRLVGSRLGKIEANDKSVLYVENTLEAGPAVLYDALVVPDGAAAISSLACDALALAFVREQYRHCKPIMVLGEGARLLHQASVPPALPDGSLDPALFGIDGADLVASISAFKLALTARRSFARAGFAG